MPGRRGLLSCNWNVGKELLRASDMAGGLLNLSVLNGASAGDVIRPLQDVLNATQNILDCVQHHKSKSVMPNICPFSKKPKCEPVLENPGLNGEHSYESKQHARTTTMNEKEGQRARVSDAEDTTKAAKTLTLIKEEAKGLTGTNYNQASKGKPIHWDSARQNTKERKATEHQ
ncbi:hypothetical protein ILUMI_01160 [Ignelater luminosus]|uniref:Uncharacterized protein n=1 Tax=Ignelater luminosus TaxID=2038154 RepID=A0A8K0DKT9_IGNLU|nr:hypothetical protein ILUMI_01160 [Ignelater luminosus]